MTHAITTQRTPDSLHDLAAAGEHAVKTGMLPEHIKTGWQFAVIAAAGSELGMAPMRAIRSLAMVKGKVIESADSQLARFKADGGRSHFEVLDDTRAVLHLCHPNGDTHTETFTIEDAKRAGLEGNTNYKKFPRAMLRSRAITAGLKSIGWEGAVGNYDPEELAGDPLEAAAAREPVRVRPKGDKPRPVTTAARLAESISEKAAAKPEARPDGGLFVKALAAIGLCADVDAVDECRRKAEAHTQAGRLTAAEFEDLKRAALDRANVLCDGAAGDTKGGGV